MTVNITTKMDNVQCYKNMQYLTYYGFSEFTDIKLRKFCCTSDFVNHKQYLTEIDDKETN